MSRYLEAEAKLVFFSRFRTRYLGDWGLFPYKGYGQTASANLGIEAPTHQQICLFSAVRLRGAGIRPLIHDQTATAVFLTILALNKTSRILPAPRLL